MHLKICKVGRSHVKCSYHRNEKMKENILNLCKNLRRGCGKPICVEKDAYVHELDEHGRELPNTALLRQGGDNSCVSVSSLLWCQLGAAMPLWWV